MIDSTKAALKWLCQHQLVSWDDAAQVYQPTGLGTAAFTANLSPEDALTLQQASSPRMFRACLVCSWTTWGSRGSNLQQACRACVRGDVCVFVGGGWICDCTKRIIGRHPWTFETPCYTHPRIALSAYHLSYVVRAVQDLARAQENLNLESDLHLTYLVSPTNTELHPPWDLVYRVIHNLQACNPQSNA